MNLNMFYSSNTLEFIRNLKKKLAIAVVIWLCVCAVFLVVYWCQNLNIFTLSPQVAEMFTGETPEDFCATQGESTSLYNNFLYAKVNRKGELILIMTDTQIDYWKNNSFSMQLLQKIVGTERQIVSVIAPPQETVLLAFYEDADIICGYEISEDFTHVYADPSDSKILYFPLMPYPCIAMQVLSGKSSDEISYTFIEYDDAGNIVEQFVWPDDVED